MAGIPDVTRDAIIDALRAGKKIEAIKLHREATGNGLKESKEFVEQLQARLYQETPAEFAEPAKRGCATLLIAAFLITVAVAILA